MLRPVDGGRKVLRLLVAGPGLGPSRTASFSWQTQRHACPVDFQPAQLVLTSSQQRWQETVRSRPDFPRRAGALRLESRPIRAISLWDFGWRCRLFQGRAVDSLRHLSRRHALAKQGGWERACAAFLSVIVSHLASLVSGRQADRLL